MNSVIRFVKKQSANVSLVLASLITCFIVGEVCIRVFELNNPTRSLMFSAETFRLDSNGAVRYFPKQNIRTVTVYKGEIEYDVTFQTNNLGLIDSKDYRQEANSSKTYYALVGDSFTAGFHGGKPWVPKLRSIMKLDDVEIYNLGVSGTGIEHFLRILRSVNQQLEITDIVILPITNDFYRRFWYPLTNSSGIRFCKETQRNEECSKQPAIARIFPLASSKEEILKIASSIVTEKNNVPIRSIKEFLRRSELLTFTVRTLRSITVGEGDEKSIEYSLNSLREIRTQFPEEKIHLIHIPQKQEIIKGEYLLKRIGERVKDIGIMYYPALEKCDWSEKMFYIRDAHPNKIGYENILKCVSGYLLAQENIRDNH